MGDDTQRLVERPDFAADDYFSAQYRETHKTYKPTAPIDTERMLVRVCSGCGTVYSQSTRICPSCSIYLTKAVPNDEAEEISQKIRVERGLESRSLTGRQIKKRLNTAGVMSVFALILQGGGTLVDTYLLHRMLSDALGALIVFSYTLLPLLVLSIVMCFFPSTIKPLHFLHRTLRHPLNVAFGNQSIVSDTFYIEAFAKFCWIVPTAGLIYFVVEAFLVLRHFMI